MGYVRKEFIGYECDKCGTMFEDFDGYCFCDNEQCIIDEMDEDEDWHVINGKWYCPNCCHYDEEKDEWVVNEDKEE